MRHVHAMRAVRPIDHVTVWGRDKERAHAFADAVARATGLPVEAADSPSAAVANADVICTTTSAKEPVLFGSDLQAGQHINLVGSAIPTTSEVDHEAVRRSKYYVDYRPAAMAAAGELLKAIDAGVVTEDHIIAEIGEVAGDEKWPHREDDDITCYKSLGVAAQDLAAARAVWALARKERAGQEVDLLG